MTRIEVETRVNPVMRLRTLAATVRAVAMGITNTVLGRVARGDVNLRAGDLAPDFTLPDASTDKPVKLSDFRGKKVVVLAFFPAAFTGG